jgi:menaquinone-9 beta-reductase
MEDAISVGCHNQNHVIIGAGMAGMSAAMRLLDAGIQPTILDAGHFPSHKVCGEFFSPECLPLLEEWGMTPVQEIRRVEFHVDSLCFSFNLPYPARSESHYTFDSRFLQKLEERGAVVRTGVRVEKMLDDRVILEDGEEIFFTSLFIGTGRLSKSALRFPYVGMKANLRREEVDCLKMCIVPGGYYGMSPVGSGEVNVAYLALKETAKAPFEGEWMEVRVPSFGIEKPLPQKNVFFIGDALARIPPCAGDGLAMGITGGVMAADFAINNQWDGYLEAWMNRYRKRLRWAGLVHQLMLRPALAKKALQGLNAFPTGFSFLFHRTRQ